MSRKCLYMVISVLFMFSGCAVVFQKGRRSDIERIKELESKINDLEATKKMLEARLQEEISNKQVKVSMEDKGLVITVMAKVLFDSGKAELKPEFLSILDKVGKILKEQVPSKYIEIQGHTDNQPIKYSGWKSNWELSCARALSVVHYLIDNCGINPQRIYASCFGEYRPVATNTTKEGRQKNRRVEIIVLPEEFKKVQIEEMEGLEEETVLEEENLK